MIVFTTWLWGNKYNESHVLKLLAGLMRHHSGPFRFVVFTHNKLSLPTIEVQPIRDPGLIGRSCFCRLRMFDPEWQRMHGFDGRIVNLDLDLVITGRIDDLFHRADTFLILQNVNADNPNPFNCSIFMLRAGQHAEVWADFTPEKCEAITVYGWPDDQGWIWHRLPNAAGWRGGKASGIYAFQKPGWPQGTDLPADARIVAFFGKRKPEMFMNLAWVRKHWHEIPRAADPERARA